MSAESCRGSKPIFGQQVRPEPVVEKSFVESVAGLINEVAPQTYNNPAHYEGKEQITWVRFDHCDINDLACFRDKIEVNGNAPPLLLLIGYTNGVQAWLIPSNGEAVEVFSWRQGPVRSLKLLLTPVTSNKTIDIFSLKRPIVAICDATGPSSNYCSVTFISLKTGEQLKTIKFKNQVHDIHANKNVVIISFPEKLAVFDAATLEDAFTVTHCFPSPGPNLNPVALGDQWLAYTERRLFPIFQSCGGMVSECSTYKSTVLHAAKSLTKSMKELGESVVSNLIGPRQGTPPLTVPSPPPVNSVAGVVTIIDTQKVNSDEVSLSSGVCKGIVAHFVAHQGSPVVAMAFDPSGMLLATADKQGHSFHVFRIIPHPMSSVQTAVHHLYTLYRGDTTAKVIDMSFSLDTRWMAVSTHRGTTHVFPITPYGGSIGMRTHTSLCVVNRLSTFQKSAGLDDTPSSGRNSPVLSASPGASKFIHESCTNLAYPNPRYPPFPNPTIIKPLVQLRQPLFQNLIGSISTGPSPSRSPPTVRSSKNPTDDIIKVSAIFASPRSWLAGSPTVPREIKRRAMDALFVMAYHGNLIEYYLEPMAVSTLPPDKITHESAIQLQVHPTAQWPLVRESTSKEIKPPLDPNSPLIIPYNPNRPRSLSPASSLDIDDPEERWMAQVEIHTHAGPHRRLWMGPQFTFKAILQTGSLAGSGGLTYKDNNQSDNLTCPIRSSPVNMPGTGGANLPVLIEAGSLTGSHDQSPRLTERYSGHFDLDTVMTQLRHDIADAMMDSPHPIDHPDGDTSGGRTGHTCSSGDEGALDMSDVMDISCDPPGPSSGRPTPSSVTFGSHPTSLTSDPPEEEIQSVTTHLSQVAVTQNLGNSSLPLLQRTRTSSLEESKGMTSSAEELCSTLGHFQETTKEMDNAWIPIDRPYKHKSYDESPNLISVERPEPREPVVSNNNKSDFEWSGSRVTNESFGSSNFTTNVTDKETTVLAWNRVVSGKNETEIQEEPAFIEQDYPVISESSRLLTSVRTKNIPSTTTSEDDMFVTTESKRDKKKKKRKPRNGNESVIEPVSTDVFEINLKEDYLDSNIPKSARSVQPDSDFDHFHTAKEYPETHLDEFHDSIDNEYFEKYEPAPVEEKEDLNVCMAELDIEEKETSSKVVENYNEDLMLRSIHDDDDLARALEEAYSSDDNMPIQSSPKYRETSRSRSEKTSEMFPFRDSSEDGEKPQLRLRTLSSINVHDDVSTDDKGETSGDDRGESSADDRKATSESDVGASPNPRTSSNSKGKKKKKKKR